MESIRNNKQVLSLNSCTCDSASRYSLALLPLRLAFTKVSVPFFRLICEADELHGDGPFSRHWLSILQAVVRILEQPKPIPKNPHFEEMKDFPNYQVTTLAAFGTAPQAQAQMCVCVVCSAQTVRFCENLM